jgi:hypothetical protein
LAQHVAQLLQATEACKVAEDARKEAQEAQKQAEVIAKAAGTTKTMKVIAKPKATEMSEGADRLRRAMRLMDDKPTYLAIQVTHLIKMEYIPTSANIPHIRTTVHRQRPCSPSPP